MAPEPIQAAAVAPRLRPSYAAVLARQPVAAVAGASELPAAVVAVMPGALVVRCLKYLKLSNPWLDQCCAAKRLSLDSFQ